MFVCLEVDLQQNPWECNCEAVPLKRWLEGLSTVIFMGEAVCHSPEKTKGVDLRSLSMELLCPELEPQEDHQQKEQTANTTDAGGVSVGYPSPGLGPLTTPWIDSIPLSVLVLSLLVLFVSAFFAAAALIAYALRIREKLPFRRQGEVDLAGIQMECGIFTEQTHHHHHLHHGLPDKPPLPLPEHNHVYDTILPREAAAKGTDPAAASHMCSNPMFQDQQDVEVNQQLQQQQQMFATSKECKGGYCPTPEKEKEWTLEVSSSPINTITGAMGALAGLHGNGILCPTVIDSQGPTPKVELVDCLFRLPTPEFRDLPDRYGRPPPRYPHTQDSQQEVGADQTLVVTTPSSLAVSGRGSQSEQGDGEQRPRLRTKPDYMEVLDRSYQF
ncbi:hypothetical protein XENOCAPTIV_023822 [Xenoophorus captivus]|uniref:LRRCT domain-containing protein n=1 Tax=Xenoophorus captivus TaxID=1517983 RepID=A0ABV0R4X0_9TELE